METNILATFLDFDFAYTKLPMITIYKYPVDMPDKFVARLFYMDKATKYTSPHFKPTKYALAKDTLEEIRNEIPINFCCAPRDESDHFNIIETWL